MTLVDCTYYDSTTCLGVTCTGDMNVSKQHIQTSAGMCVTAYQYCVHA